MGVGPNSEAAAGGAAKGEAERDEEVEFVAENAGVGCVESNDVRDLAVFV